MKVRIGDTGREIELPDPPELDLELPDLPKLPFPVPELPMLPELPRIELRRIDWSKVDFDELGRWHSEPREPGWGLRGLWLLARSLVQRARTRLAKEDPWGDQDRFRNRAEELVPHEGGSRDNMEHEDRDGAYVTVDADGWGLWWRYRVIVVPAPRLSWDGDWGRLKTFHTTRRGAVRRVERELRQAAALKLVRDMARAGAEYLRQREIDDRR